MALVDKTVQIDVLPYTGDRKRRVMNITFDDLIEKMKVCQWDWHLVEDIPETEINEYEQAKKSYVDVLSVLDALKTKYEKDSKNLNKVNEIFNQHAPPEYQIPTV